MRGQAIVVLLIGATLVVPCEGQRSVGGMQGGSIEGGLASHGLGGHLPFPNAPFHGNFRFRHFQNFGGVVWIPWDWPWDDWRLGPYDSDKHRDQNGFAPPVIIEKSAAPAPALPPEPPKVIEVAISKKTPSSKIGPPTLFVLATGGRLETRRYTLTVDYLDAEVGGQHRRVPMSELDLSQTIAANHARGIEIKVPHDRREVFVGF